MKELQRIDIEVCVDCVSMIGAGEITDDPDRAAENEAHAAAMEARWPDHGPAFWELAYLDNEDTGELSEHFGWSACDGCGRGEGGSRFDAVAMLWVSERDWETELAAFVDGYDQCLRWVGIWDSDSDDDEPEYDSVRDWDAEAALSVLAECADFMAANYVEMVDAAAVIGRTVDWGRMGHDFYLTREGHGTGFWDRGYGELGDRLSEAAKVYGSANVFIGDDGLIYS